MTFHLDCDFLTTWTYESFHIISINQVWFKSDFNFSNEAIFTFSAYLTTWPQMTFDCGIWPLTAWTYEGSNIISINQVWFQSDFNLSSEAAFTFWAYLKLDLRWPLTLICNLWPHQQMTVPILHLWPNFGWNTLKHVEVKAKCYLFSQQTIITTDNNNINRQHRRDSGEVYTAEKKQKVW